MNVWFRWVYVLYRGFVPKIKGWARRDVVAACCWGNPMSVAGRRSWIDRRLFGAKNIFLKCLLLQPTVVPCFYCEKFL